jgi:hypothetical protein
MSFFIIARFITASATVWRRGHHVKGSFQARKAGLRLRSFLSTAIATNNVPGSILQEKLPGCFARKKGSLQRAFFENTENVQLKYARFLLIHFKIAVTPPQCYKATIGAAPKDVPGDQLCFSRR